MDGLYELFGGGDADLVGMLALHAHAVYRDRCRRGGARLHCGLLERVEEDGQTGGGRAEEQGDGTADRCVEEDDTQ